MSAIYQFRTNGLYYRVRFDKDGVTAYYRPWSITHNRPRRGEIGWTGYVHTLDQPQWNFIEKWEDPEGV